ncbi:oxidation resistance protein 1 [Sorochytrium milnesiophthora]
MSSSHQQGPKSTEPPQTWGSFFWSLLSPVADDDLDASSGELIGDDILNDTSTLSSSPSTARPSHAQSVQVPPRKQSLATPHHAHLPHRAATIATSSPVTPIDVASSGSWFAAPALAGDAGDDFEILRQRRESVSSVLSEPTPIALTHRDAVRDPVLTEEIAQQLRGHLPRLLRLPTHWRLVYSLDQHGISLNTLYTNCRRAVENGWVNKRGAVLILRDNGGAVFGAFLSDYLQPSQGFFGNGETFVFKVVDRASLFDPITGGELTADPESTDASTAGDDEPIFPRPRINTTDGELSRSRTSTSRTQTLPLAYVSSMRSDSEEAFDMDSSQLEHLENYFTESMTNLADDDGDDDDNKQEGAGGAELAMATTPDAGLPSQVVKVYPWSGKNDYFELCEQNYFAIGAGNGEFAIYLDHNLEYGSSAAVPTFQNDILCTAQPAETATTATAPGKPLSNLGNKARINFMCMNLELWGIVD